MSLCKVLPRLLPKFRAFSSLNRAEAKTDEASWSSAIKEAERVVGYPTSFLSLRWILNDEIANVASHIRKLIGTNHPLLKIAKDLLLRNELPTWGLIVLLVSKAAGLNSTFSEIECDRTADILHSQRIIAEVTEMIKTSNLIHRGLIDIEPKSELAEELHFGNKLALLSGDYLLSASFREIARLRNFLVQETISSTLRDLSESEFIGLRDGQNRPLPSKPLPKQSKVAIPLPLGNEPFQVRDVLGNMRSEWTLRNVLGGASLLGKCCQSSLILGRHSAEVQKVGYVFGRNLALAWQASLEGRMFGRGGVSLVSAPVMLQLEDDPGLYDEIEKGLASVDDVDFEVVKDRVVRGKGLEKAEGLKREFTGSAMEALERFPDSESKAALVSIVNKM